MNKIVLVIITAAIVLAITSAWNDSLIVDEIPHIGAGYSYVSKGDYRLNPEHPPLAKDVAGLPLKFLNLKQDAFATEFWSTDINGQWDFGRRLIFNSGNDAIKITHLAKLPLLIFFALSAVLIYIWARRLNGKIAALIALFLFVFSPTVIAHSRFVTTDIPALFGILLASYFFIKFLKNRSYKNLAFAGITFGVAQLTKFSLFLLVPYFVLLALAYGFTYENKKFRNAFKCLLQTILIIIIGYVVVVWPVYGLHTVNYPPALQKRDTTDLIQHHANKNLADAVIELSDKPIIRPMAHYALGLLMVKQRSVGGNTTYFLGEVKKEAWKKYFPFVYFTKEPLPFWGLVIIALGLLLTRIRRVNITIWIRNNFDKFAMLLWLAIYWYTSITSNLNIGVRHLIPVYGFTYILLTGPIAAIIQNVKRKTQNNNLKFKKLFFFAFSFTIYALFGWYLIENIKVYPNYLTYFNQTVGGPSGGYRYVVDSNLDWGQDAKRLADWIRQNNIEEKIHLDYFGWADPSYYYGDKYLYLYRGKYKSLEEFLNDNPQGGWIAISATFYMNSREKVDTSYAWLDPVKPITVIGNSIFIWNIRP